MKKYLMGLGFLLIVVTAIIFVVNHTQTTTQTTTTSQKLYVALGDSVAAGVGLDGDSDSSACDRTNQSYPNQLAAMLHYRLSNIACSGATLSAGIIGSQDVNQLAVTPQLQQLLRGPKPNIITLTIGANDVGWTTILATCYTSECGSADDTAAANASLVTVGSNLQSVLTQIQQHYGTNPPRVIVTGYHQVFPVVAAAGCTDLTGIDASELAWGRQLQANINETLQQATAQYSFATFAPINFSGHELCTSDPWVQGLSDKQPYHPTAAGQAAFAGQLAVVIKALH